MVDPYFWRLEELRRDIERLGTHPARMGPAAAKTEMGQVYDLYRAGSQVEEGDGWFPTGLTVEEQAVQLLETLRNKAATIEGPFRVCWRTEMRVDQITFVMTSEDAHLGILEVEEQLYARLCFEPLEVEEPTSGWAPVPGTGRTLDPKPAETEPLLQFFEYLHLPPHLQDVSQPFCVLAETIVRTLPRNSERTVALRKLLEAKDCAVRAALMR